MGYLAGMDYTDVRMLVGVGAFFVVFGLYMMLRPLEDDGMTRLRLCGVVLSVPSAGLLVFALGVLFLADRLLAPGLAAQAASLIAMKTALGLVAEAGGTQAGLDPRVREIWRLRGVSAA